MIGVTVSYSMPAEVLAEITELIAEFEASPVAAMFASRPAVRGEFGVVGA